MASISKKASSARKQLIHLENILVDYRQQEIGSIHAAGYTPTEQYILFPETLFWVCCERAINRGKDEACEIKGGVKNQLEHEAAWCSTFSCLKSSQTRDSAGFQVSLSQKPN
ncbi:hypothetical protein CSKR_101562 [Clonorchis sinensis]|uniref:Uncharacterized protein n=1 Tax=Clonorchis sinensis TaxID=79923 RepID=A0A3R7GF15_CLOSI|nr:hypothetical protein CSKR_101562 [Clonorchis sinensis]